MGALTADVTIIGILFLVVLYLVIRELQEKEHVHRGASWDGWREHCACGASAGDKKDKDGLRYNFFSEWPER